MTQISGEIIEKEPSRWKIIGSQVLGLFGFLFSLAWIAFLLLITYFEPIKQSFFQPSWYSIGIIIAIIPSVGTLCTSLIQLFVGKPKYLPLAESINSFVTAICLFLLSDIYPFKFGNWDNIIPTVFLIIAILSGIATISHFNDYLKWDNK